MALSDDQKWIIDFLSLMEETLKDNTPAKNFILQSTFTELTAFANQFSELVSLCQRVPSAHGWVLGEQEGKDLLNRFADGAAVLLLSVLGTNLDEACKLLHGRTFGELCELLSLVHDAHGEEEGTIH